MRSVGVLAFVALAAVVLGSYTPEQVHIALAGKGYDVVVSWITTSDTEDSYVEFGSAPGQYSLNASGKKGSHYVWPDPPPIYKSGQIHFVTLSNLQPGTTYYYRCGDKTHSLSGEFSFTTHKPGPAMTIGVVGDIGTTQNSLEVIDGMLRRHTTSPLDFMIHAGDLSYANGNQTIWDTFGQLIQPLTARVPYMVAPGNHEAISLFVPYQARFQMPAESSGSHMGNLYYSFNYGSAHVIALDSETLQYEHASEQYRWLSADLGKVNRAVTPWVIAFFHSPWYSSNTVHEGSGETMRESYEELFQKSKVDLVVCGHVHAYERVYPVYNNKVTPGAPEYRTVGNGGNKEGLYNSWISPIPAWSAFRGAFYGFATIQIFNATHMYWEAMRASNYTVADSSWVIRQR